MGSAYPSPGVYREERFLAPAAPLATGVPGFVGFGATGAGMPVELRRAEELRDRFEPPDGLDGYLEAAVVGFFANGGRRCFVVGANAEHNPGGNLIAALTRLAPVTDLDLVAIPDIAWLPDADSCRRVERALLTHCAEQGDRFAILDAPRTIASEGRNIAAAFAAWRRGLAGAALANAACYYPWVQVADAAGTKPRSVPPCGHVAGVFARSDAAVGVFKAPANQALDGIVDLASHIDTDTQAVLNPIGINCLRALPGRGLRLYGARTLSQDPQWRYVNARRLVLTLTRWIDRNLAWAAFEPNTPGLWQRIRRELDVHLGGLWQVGALEGARPADAFRVQCDAEINPPEGREQGRVLTEIALRPAAPAERIVLRITHGMSGARIDAQAAPQ